MTRATPKMSWLKKKYDSYKKKKVASRCNSREKNIKRRVLLARLSIWKRICSNKDNKNLQPKISKKLNLQDKNLKKHLMTSNLNTNKKSEF